MPWKRYTARRQLTDRQPTEKSQLTWLQREVDPLIKEIRLVLNWCAEYVGLVQVDDDQTPVDLTTSLVAGANIAITKTGASPTKKLTISATGLPTAFPGYYEYNPEPDGVANPGDDARVSHGNHVHPLVPTPQITNVFYLEPGLGQHHLVNPCPSTVSSVQFAFPTTPAAETSSVTAVTLNSSPGLIDWAGGTCNVVLRAKVDSLIGTTHQIAIDLHRIPVGGGAGTRYCSAVQPWVGADEILTGDIQVLRFSVPVKFLTGPATDLLQMTIYALPGLGGSVDTEIMYVETGADGSTVLVNGATQIQTLFGSSSGGPIEHEQTTGRDLPNQHPYSALEPVGTATMPMPTLTIASGGKLTLTAGNIFVVNPDGNDLAQITPPACESYETVPIRLIFTLPLSIQNQTVPDSGFATVYTNEAGSVNAPLGMPTGYCSVDMVFIGGMWLLTSQRSTE